MRTNMKSATPLPVVDVYIPVKSNSEGVKNKCFRDFNGSSLYERTLKFVSEAAEDKKRIANIRIHVLCDDDSFDYVSGCGFGVPVEIHTVKEPKGIAEEFEAARVDVNTPWILLQPTSPFRDRRVFDSIVHMMLSYKLEYVYFTSMRLKLVGKLTRGIHQETCYQGDRQNADNWFDHWDGNILACTAKDSTDKVLGLKDALTIHPDYLTPFTESMPYNLQIDTEDEWDLALKIDESSVGYDYHLG